MRSLSLVCKIHKMTRSMRMRSWQTHVSGILPDEARRQLSLGTVLPDDLLKEAIPGNIRKAEHFVAFLKRFVEYLKVTMTARAKNVWQTYCWQTRMRVLHVVAETPLSFLQHLKDITYIERRPLRFCAERLQSLIRTLQLQRLDEYATLQTVASFATLVSTYEKGQSRAYCGLTLTVYEGFLLILEPFETDNATIPNPVFRFTWGIQFNIFVARLKIFSSGA